MVLPILITLVAGIFSLWLLFDLALGPQIDLLQRCGWPHWLAWFTAMLAVLVESAIANIILLLVLFGCTQSAISRATLEECGVLAQIRLERGTEELPETCCARDISHSIVFLIARLPLLLLTLPLNGIPVAGQVAWVVLNGWLYTWELTGEFMVMLEDRHRCGEQWEFVKKRFPAYCSFGAVAMSLELIPFVGPWFFFASNACGAAFLMRRFFAETHGQEGGVWHCKKDLYSASDSSDMSSCSGSSSEEHGRRCPC